MAASADPRGILAEPLLGADDVARLLGVPKSSVYEYARTGVLPSVRLGRYRRFLRSDLEDAVARLRRRG